MQVPFYRHALERSDSLRIADVLATPFLTSGDVGRQTEALLCEFFEVNHAILVNSCTNGGVAALLALDVGPGDEVIVPAMTFIATANMAELVGARPVFADVDTDTLLLTSDHVVGRLTPKTKAVIPVHMYGQMADIAAMRHALDAAGRTDVAIVEDAAHCFEGSYAGDLPGRHSDVAVFSFYATKNVTCGEGGAVITNDADLFERLQQTRLHGMSAGAVDRFKGGHYRHWDMLRLGTKANLPDLLAALLPPQIETVRDRLPIREELCQRYEEAFSGAPIRTAKTLQHAVSARHLFPIHVKPEWRDEFIYRITQNGVGATVNYRSVPRTSYYKGRYKVPDDAFPNSGEWGDGTLSLPMFPGLTSEEQNYVIDTVMRELEFFASKEGAPPMSCRRGRN